MGVSSRSESGKAYGVPSWMAPMSCLAYLRLQRLPVPGGGGANPACVHKEASMPNLSILAASISA